MEVSSNHKAGFVSIIGKPNVGKSTLMNTLVGEKLSIVTSKAQTTRHRIMGIINDPEYQIVYSDTPGIIKPAYELQQSMMNFVTYSLEDADLILFVTDLYDPLEEEVINKLKKVDCPVFLVINKIDILNPETIDAKIAEVEEIVKPTITYRVSALAKQNTDDLLNAIVETLPIHPPYYPKDELTDKPERFFAAEIVREKILLNYKKEIPYSTEVVVEEFKEKEDIIKIRAIIYCERNSQKGILIGHQGEMLKKTGTMARLELEKFFDKKVFLETHIKVEPDWRSKAAQLRRFGYDLE
ncbi:MAG: hypothetical protein RLZZ175_462 [Bacteroidota bacterium]|jgi:GTP-binding protein Era